MAEAYIIGALRTAVGRRHGKLKDWHPIDLGAHLLNELIARTGTDPNLVEDVIFGCVDQVGAQAANIARNVVLSAGLPETLPATTVDRQCGSSQQALHFAAQAVMSGVHDVVIAGGVEVMSLVPIGGNAVAGHKAGYGVPYGAGMKRRYPGVKFNQFAGAEMMAQRWGLTREQLDAFGLSSHRKAARATREGRFAREIVPVTVSSDDGTVETFEQDEGIRYDASPEAMAALKPLSEIGLLTAGTSSQISDGAAAVLVANEQGLKRLGAKARARIHAMTLAADDPVMMLGAPIPATSKLLAKAGLRIGDIDLYEVNEAFASVPLAWAKELGADLDKLNVNGGAIALGHPLGCTGAKLMTSLLHELERRAGRYGLQTMCEGGGLANATLIERL
ncbi:MAG: acetyl-CoA C-acetyltransferase [Deltaproteobacteria bacterium]|nr:acetyl-CoA C-acetyltransferase [Deltaproteobacteria bacterium]